MNDEILQGCAISDFLETEESKGWNPDTRRYYANCLHDLLDYTAQHGAPTPELLERWERQLQTAYAPSAVNVHLAAANNYFKWCGRYDLLRGHTKAKPRGEPTPTLTRAEYLKLLGTARRLGRHRIYLLIKLFATTDLPLQCLEQATAELVQAGRGTLHSRGNPIEFYCPPALQRELLDYMAENGIYHGPVFITRGGRMLERPSIFRSMKEICQAAGVPEEKGNPRALRNLYKATQRDIERRLALLRQQMIDQTLELEQQAVGWQNEPTASRGRSA